MTIEERRDLSKARFDRARDCLHTAKVNRDISDYRAAANRSYYAIFHSMRAVLAFVEVDMSKHSGVMAEFRKRYLLFLDHDGFKPFQLGFLLPYYINFVSGFQP